MTVATCVSVTALVVLSLLLNQATAASLGNRGGVHDIDLSIKDLSDGSTDATIVTSGLTDAPEESTKSQSFDAADELSQNLAKHQHAVKFLRLYKYLPQEVGTDCESCSDDCHSKADCLTELQKLLVEPLEAYQKFNNLVIDGKVSDTILQLMDVPRCGDTDDKKDGKGSRQKRWTKLGTTVWSAELMPLQISVANGVRGFSVSDVESIALDCARLWAEPSSLSFQLAPVGSRKGNIAIEFAYIDGKWNTVGLGLSPIIWGDKSSYLKLDRDEMWKRDTKTEAVGVSLKWAICHEMGHNLGLSHSNDRKAIMYPSGIGQSEERLPTDDYNGITNLYRGRNGKTVFGRARGGGSRSPAPRTTRRPPATTRRTTQRPTPRPTQRRTNRPTTRRTTRPPPVTSRYTTRYEPYDHTYRHYKPPSQRRYAPPGHEPHYRPKSTRRPTRAPTQAPSNYWWYNEERNQWVYG